MGAIWNYVRLLQIDLLDLFEITVVAVLIYRVLILWSGTRAFQMLFGLVLLVAVYATAGWFRLSLIESILSQAFTYGAFALIVVFHPELRSALARIGRSPVLSVLTRLEERSQAVADEIAKAAAELSRAGTGAIIAIERELSLEEYIEKTGTRLRADVSASLLVSLFTPQSPLHDGAVVVRGGEIVAAGVHLPLTQYPLSDKTLGTRHRATLGLSEETDAYVVVVSEETSQISLARRGVLRRNLTPGQLRDHLAAGVAAPELGPAAPEAESDTSDPPGADGHVVTAREQETP
ncbi:diadenylate cyclase CdaA [Candidatus Palauibacter sp.]|uniref:diadenylate cyclase CdaA n=1 Tax=Candidatus Palauibacter sp. TaxID=3101350 RepID=UPI003AF2BE9D